MESFNEQALRAKHAAGFKGGPFNKSPILHPAMTFVDGTAPESVAKLMHKGVPSMNVENPWFNRKGN